MGGNEETSIKVFILLKSRPRVKHGKRKGQISTWMIQFEGNPVAVKRTSNGDGEVRHVNTVFARCRKLLRERRVLKIEHEFRGMSAPARFGCCSLFLRRGNLARQSPIR